MHQPTRRILAAAGLAAILLVAAPASSRAAVFGEGLVAPGFSPRVWSWLEGLLAASPAAPARPSARSTKIGVGIDPNGGTDGLDTSTAPDSRKDQGSMIDPNGRK